MKNTLYIPINSNSLAHYLNRALIMPSKYLQNKPEDIQDTLMYSLLLSKNRWLKNSDCSIEVVLTEIELKNLEKLSDNFFRLRLPIPVSRIKKVFFLDKNQMDVTAWNINNGAAFIPQDLITVDYTSNIQFVDLNFVFDETKVDHINEIEKKINRFDTVLGGFAFMKIGGKEFENISMEYSENYFATLSYFNKLIEEQTVKAENDKGLIFNRKYTGLFSKNDSEWVKWQPYIYRHVELNDVEDIARKEGIKIETKLGVINVDAISNKSHLYDIAVLATYGDRKNKSVEDLVNSLHNGKIPEDKVEDISLLFGLNIGYSKLRNKYKTKANSYNVKFKLDTKLDYYTIESVYQFIFNNNKNNYNFNYIDELKFSDTFNIKNSNFETYYILDKLILTKKKLDSLEHFFAESSKNIYKVLTDSMKKWMPDFVKFDDEKLFMHFQDVLGNSLFEVFRGFQKKIINEYREKYDSEREKFVLDYESRINSLLDINNKLKEDFENFQKMIKGKEKNYNNIIVDNNYEYGEEEISDFPMYIQKRHSDLSLQDLKKMAKAKKIKNFSTKTKEELITLINDIPPTPTLPL